MLRHSVAAPLGLLALSHALPALTVSRRHQRSTPTRPRSSTWEEKTRKFEERKREQQEEAARAARRRARYAAGANKATTAAAAGGDRSSASFSSLSGESAMDEERSSVGASTSNPALTKPSMGFWGFLRGGREGRKSQPMNPLVSLARIGDRSKADYDPDARAAQRVVDAVNELRQRNARRRDPMTITVTDEQRQELVSRYAETRWYGFLYRPVRNVSESRLRWGRRISRVIITVCVFAVVGVLLWSYYMEMTTVAKLSPQDREDYAYMVQGMRYSDIFKEGTAVLKRDDPLEALPPEVRMHLMLEACRAKNWHRVNWDVELRSMHPKSAVEEWDYIHILYWAMMRMGEMATGNGGLLNDRVRDVAEVRQGNVQSAEERDRFAQLEPTSKPEVTKRGFFS